VLSELLAVLRAQALALFNMPAHQLVHVCNAVPQGCGQCFTGEGEGNSVFQKKMNLGDFLLNGEDCR
jgi:hypothetical protein